MRRLLYLLPVASLPSGVACADTQPAETSPTFEAPDATADSPLVDAHSDDATEDPADVQSSHDADADVGVDADYDAPADGPGDGPEDGQVEGEADAGDVWVELGAGVWVTPGRPAPGTLLRIRYEGALASATQVTAHYGFNGWNDLAGTGAIGQDDGTSNLDYYLETALVTEGGSHVGQVMLPQGARSIHLVFRATQAGTEVWDNHNQRDYNLGIRFPYLGPFLTWLPSSSPAEHIEVHFHTGLSCAAFVEHGQGSLSESTPAGSGVMHHAVLAGLSADTEYLYRVGCEGHAPSETFTFRTAPTSSTSLTFAVAADAQDNGETGRWAEVAAAIEAHQPRPALLLFAGDLPWNDKPGLWWTFFDKAAPLLARTPLLAVPGNHDTPTVDSHPDTSTFEWLFGLDGTPPRQLTRSLRWGPASFVLLSSETPGDFLVSGGSQYDWAEQQLGVLAAVPWVFASLHIGPYNAGARHMSQQGDFRDLTQLFDGIVDWSFSGHEHLYQRMKPLHYNGVLAPSAAYGRGPQDGVGYLITPPAGAWPETQLVAWDDPKAYYRERLAYPTPVVQQNTAASEQGFVVVTLAGKQMNLRAYGMGAPAAPVPVHIVDELTYTKP